MQIHNFRAENLQNCNYACFSDSLYVFRYNVAVTFENSMTVQSATFPGMQAVNTFVQPAKEGENDTAPHKVACPELSGTIGQPPFTIFLFVRRNVLNIFQFVKSQITTRQAAEHYGLNVQRNGMTLCPFHDDHAPSLKVDTRFYCFGCQVKGDVIDFVSKLFGLSLIQAAQKLAADFGLDPNTPQSAAVVPAQPPVVQQRRLVLECTKALTDYERLLNHWKTAYAPADMNAPWDGRFAQALHELPAIGHVLDLLYSADAKLREDTAKALVNTGALQRIQTNLKHYTEEEQFELEKEENRPAA